MIIGDSPIKYRTRATTVGQVNSLIQLYSLKLTNDEYQHPFIVIVHFKMTLSWHFSEPFLLRRVATNYPDPIGLPELPLKFNLRNVTEIIVATVFSYIIHDPLDST
jgi:hypothetical protein